MTKNDVIDMAREAGFDVKEWGDETLVRTVHSKGYFVVINQKLEDFAKLVAAKEQARCCSIVYGMAGSDNVAQRTVDAIRGKK